MGVSAQQYLPTSYKLLRLNSQAKREELGLDVGDEPLCVSFGSDSLESLWADIVRKTKEDGLEEFSDAFLVAVQCPRAVASAGYNERVCGRRLDVFSS